MTMKKALRCPRTRSSFVVAGAVVLSWGLDLMLHYAAYVFFEEISTLVSIVMATLGVV